MSLESRIISLAQAIGADVKALRAERGNLASLSTTAKSNLVDAINEIYSIVGNGNGATINDSAGNGNTTVTWSADKIYDSIEAAKVAVQDSILGGASAAYDTLLELEQLATSNSSTAAALATAINNRVRYDAAQTLTTEQQLQACTNIGIGNPESDFSATYSAAKL